MALQSFDISNMRLLLTRGTPAAVVTRWLDEHKIEHSGYVENERIISAAIRNQGSDGVVTKTILLTFRFDEDGNLQTIESKDGFTGP